MKGIYCISNNINNKCYIGSSKNIKLRKGGHISRLRNNRHPNQHLQNSWNKYGQDNFIFEILEQLPKECTTEELLAREQYYLDTLKPEYNILKIAGSIEGYKHLEETKLKISKSMKGVRKSSEHTKHIRESQQGKIFTEDHKNKLSKAAKNRDKSTLEYKNTKIIIDNIVYNSIKEASEITNIKYNTIQKRLSNDNFKNYQYVISKEVKKCKDITKGTSFRNRSVIIDEIEYESALKASRILGMCVDTIKYRIVSETFTNYNFK